MGMMLGGGRQKADINVTPMIDVLLVLLIIFMVITPLKPVGLRSLIPQPAPDASPAPDPLQLVVYIKPGGQVEVNRQPMPTSDLPAKLIAVFARQSDAVIFVDGDKHLEYGDIARVIDMIRGAGFDRIGLMPGRQGS